MIKTLRDNLRGICQDVNQASSKEDIDALAGELQKDAEFVKGLIQQDFVDLKRVIKHFGHDLQQAVARVIGRVFISVARKARRTT